LQALLENTTAGTQLCYDTSTEMTVSKGSPCVLKQGSCGRSNIICMK